MSLQSWMDEFIVSMSSEDAEAATDAELLDIAAKKWEGLRAENLAKHGVRKYGLLIVGATDEDMADYYDSRSCPLCYKYENSCGHCPITLSDKDARTCDTALSFTAVSAWRQWNMNNNPEPMIERINTAIIWIKEAAK